MKKKILTFVFALGLSANAFAFSTTELMVDNNFENLKIEMKKGSVKQIQSEVKVLAFVPPGGGLVYTWTSTCGKPHRTTFPSNYSLQQIANYISDANKAECGVRPNVIVEIAPSMY